MSSKQIIVGIGGPSCSGKSNLARHIVIKLEMYNIEYLSLDSYYKDLSDLPFSKRQGRNYDAPESFDLPLLYENLRSLHDKGSAEVPIYDYKSHLRTSNKRLISKPNIFIIDGILIFHIEKLRQLMDITIYVDIDHETALARRIERDTRTRGRSREAVIEQYNATVRPMCLRYIEPTRQYADLVIDGSRPTVALTEEVAGFIRDRLNRK